MNLIADPVQTQTSQFIGMGLSGINALYEGSGPSTHANRTRRPKGGSHWSAHNHIFDETTEFGVSEAKSDDDYNYKTEFQIWKEKK